MFPQCAYQSSRSRSISAGSCFSPSPTVKNQEGDESGFEALAVRLIQFHHLFPGRSKGKGDSLHGIWSSSEACMSERLCRKNKEADQTHGAIAEQIDVAIHRGRKLERKIVNQCVGRRSQPVA